MARTHVFNQAGADAVPPERPIPAVLHDIFEHPGRPEGAVHQYCRAYAPRLAHSNWSARLGPGRYGGCGGGGRRRGDVRGNASIRCGGGFRGVGAGRPVAQRSEDDGPVRDDFGSPVRQASAVDREETADGYWHLSASCWYP